MPIQSSDKPHPTIITVGKPPMGGKIWLLEEKGCFVLDIGSGLLRTIACTHAGSGHMTVFDGVPDDNGFFPDEAMAQDHPEYYRRNGRPIYRANSVVMGSWMLDGGYHHGLTVLHHGGSEGANAVASIVWMPVKTATA